MEQRCPHCGSLQLHVWKTREDLESEVILRTRLVESRLFHKPEPAERMDLTDFMHGDAVPILRCAGCGVAVRLEHRAATYSTDVYDPVLLRHLYPRYLAPFRHKARAYSPLLPAHADVLEVGTHTGAFLQAAEECHWTPIGVDVGGDTASFARSLGFRIYPNELETARLPMKSLHAVFVWNCFEQLAAPAETLKAAHGLLQRHGLIVVRVPNFAYYEQSRKVRTSSLLYNNLLGFPYLHGYSPFTLASLLRQQGFDPVYGFDSTLVTMPFAELSPQLRREINRVYSPYGNTSVKPPAQLCGPWIEIAARRLD